MMVGFVKRMETTLVNTYFKKEEHRITYFSLSPSLYSPLRPTRYQRQPQQPHSCRR